MATPDTLDRIGRLGVAAVGVVHLLLAWIAVQIALGGSREQASGSGALRELADKPLGTALVAGVGVGLALYAAWQAAQAAVGYARDDGARRTAKRVGAAGKALVGLALTATCLSIVTGSGGGGGTSEQALTARLMAAPAGRMLVGAVGVAVLALAAFLVHRGVTRGFTEKLEPGVPEGQVTLGRIGYVARGAAFAIVGGLVVLAAVRADPQRSGGLDEALGTLAAQPFGVAALLAVAAGFACFGAFQVLTARRHREG